MTKLVDERYFKIALLPGEGSKVKIFVQPCDADEVEIDIRKASIIDGDTQYSFDSPGRKLAETIQELLESENCLVEVVEAPPSVEEQIEALRELLADNQEKLVLMEKRLPQEETTDES